MWVQVPPPPQEQNAPMGELADLASKKQIVSEFLFSNL